MGTSAADSRERADLLWLLSRQRGFLRHTVKDLTDEQAARRTTASELCVGGLIKHVSSVEYSWVTFIGEGSAGMARRWENAGPEAFAEGFRMSEGETLSELLADYEKTAARTEEVIGSLPDLDADQALPDAPWFPKGTRWSARQVLLHIAAETAQHSGHADIIRESIDGQKTMG